jgi:hypothetical protein
MARFRHIRGRIGVESVDDTGVESVDDTGIGRLC